MSHQSGSLNIKRARTHYTTTKTTCNRYSGLLSSCSNITIIITYLFLTTVLLVIVTCCNGNAAISRGKTNNITDDNSDDNREASLFYTRLRYDEFYLPIYKNLQKRFPYEEKQNELRLPQQIYHSNGHKDNDDDRSSQTVSYFLNTNISLHDLTQNDLILEALDQVYKSKLIQSYQLFYDNSADRKLAADPVKVDKKRCHHELDYLLSKVTALNRYRRGIQPELAAFFDSYANQEAGVLLGDVFWLGNWNQCHKRHIFDPHHKVSFTGRYCVASIRPELEWQEKIEKKIAHLKGIDYFKYDNQEFYYRRHFRIQLGICLPESCDSQIVHERHSDIQKLTLMKLSEPYDTYNLTDLYCLPDESSPLRKIPSSGYLLITLSAVWLLLILFSTFADYHDLVGLKAIRKGYRKNFNQRLVISFSLLKSYHYLNHVSRPLSLTINQLYQDYGSDQTKPLATQEDTKPAVSDLYFLDAFKVLATMIILLGHIGMCILQFSQYQLDFFTIGPTYFHFLASTAFYVDWFFCMTGLITAYTMFASRAAYTNKYYHWLYSIFHRYWRLAPIYVLTFWFCRDLFQYTNSGPLWDYGTSNTSLRAICQQESWLIPLTLTSNWYPLHRECIMPAWYIANDMQFYLITPILLILLAYRTRLAWMSIIGMSLVSVVARVQQYMTDPHAQHLELMHPRFDLIMRNNWDLHRIYLWPHYRISPYLIGLLAGHYAFMVKSGKWKSPFTPLPPPQKNHSPMIPINNGRQAAAASTATAVQQQQLKLQNAGSCDKNSSQQYSPTCWRKNRALLAWTGLIVTCVMSMTSMVLDLMFPRYLEPYAKVIATIIYSTCHTIAGCGVAALFLAFLLGHWPRVRQLMELPIWTRLARINYFVYLFQVEIIIWASNSMNRLPEQGIYEQYKMLFFLGPILYGLAWLVTLLVANPLAKLEIEFVGVYMQVDKPEHNKNNLLRVEREKQEQVASATATAAVASASPRPPNGEAVEVLDEPKSPTSSACRPVKQSSSSSSSSSTSTSTSSSSYNR